jgi:hypothetical protein
VAGWRGGSRRRLGLELRYVLSLYLASAIAGAIRADVPMTALFGSVHNSGGGSITASSPKASAAADACNYRDAEHSDSAGYDHLGAVVTKFSVAMSDATHHSPQASALTPDFPQQYYRQSSGPGVGPT